MQKWEYLKIYIMLEQGRLFSYQSQKIIEDRQVMEGINALGKSGWELVNVVEEIGNKRDENENGKALATLLDFAIAGPRVTTATQHKAVTLGYYLWFKRPYEPRVCPNCKTENSLMDTFCSQCGAKIV